MVKRSITDVCFGLIKMLDWIMLPVRYNRSSILQWELTNVSDIGQFLVYKTFFP